jgi:molybdenum cofactor cytidylyltransferase
VIRASAIVPAAGKGERFSRSRDSALQKTARDASLKMLADVDGEPMLGRTIRLLIDAGVTDVIVVLAVETADAIAAAACPADPRVRVVLNADPSRGMLSSIQIGVAAATGDPMLLLPGDMPFVSPTTVSTLLAAYRQDPRLISPRCDGRRGHPLVLPTSLRTIIAGADPTSDLNTVLAAYKTDRLDVDVTDRGILRDVDVVGDLT